MRSGADFDPCFVGELHGTEHGAGMRIDHGQHLQAVPLARSKKVVRPLRQLLVLRAFLRAVVAWRDLGGQCLAALSWVEAFEHEHREELVYMVWVKHGAIAVARVHADVLRSDSLAGNQTL